MDHFAGMHYRVERTTTDTEKPPPGHLLPLVKSKRTPPWVLKREMDEAAKPIADDVVRIFDRSGAVVREFHFKDRQTGIDTERRIVEDLLRLDAAAFRAAWGVGMIPSGETQAQVAPADPHPAAQEVVEDPVAGLPVAGLPVAGLPVAGLPVEGPAVAGDRAGNRFRVERVSESRVEWGAGDQAKGGRNLFTFRRSFRARGSTPAWVKALMPEAKKMEDLPPEVAAALGIPVTTSETIRILGPDGEAVAERTVAGREAGDTLYQMVVEDLLGMDTGAFRAKYEIGDSPPPATPP